MMILQNANKNFYKNGRLGFNGYKTKSSIGIEKRRGCKDRCFLSSRLLYTLWPVSIAYARTYKAFETARAIEK